MTIAILAANDNGGVGVRDIQPKSSSCLFISLYRNLVVVGGRETAAGRCRRRLLPLSLTTKQSGDNMFVAQASAGGIAPSTMIVKASIGIMRLPALRNRLAGTREALEMARRQGGLYTTYCGLRRQGAGGSVAA